MQMFWHTKGVVKGVVRNGKSKDKSIAKRKATNNDLQNTKRKVEIEQY